MDVSTQQLAQLVGGRLIGSGTVLCQGATPPADALAGDVTLLDDPKRIAAMVGCRATAVVTTEQVDFAGHQIIVPNAHAAFTKIVSLFRPPIPGEVPTAGMHPSAMVDPTAMIHPSAVVGAGAVIGSGVQIMPGVVIMPRCRIGKDCVIHASVTLYEYTVLAERVTIHAGSVLGAHGFGYRQQGGRHVPTAQLGYVQVDSDVEIGAGVTIDRGTYGATRIGEGTKIDNQVMIAHNCRIGRHNLICSQVGVAGSCSTGDYVVLAGQVGLKDHIHLGDQTTVCAQAGVMDDCQGNAVLLGSPATNYREQMQIMATQRKLPEMRRELKTLRKEISALRQLLTAAEIPSERKAA